MEDITLQHQTLSAATAVFEIGTSGGGGRGGAGADGETNSLITLSIINLCGGHEIL